MTRRPAGSLCWLSTPSLGITEDGVGRPIASETSLFQLPLSGSQKNLCCVGTASSYLTFNSLSRDHSRHGDERDLAEESFNSLSRDHEDLNVRLGMVEEFVLSTPSLGITSCSCCCDCRPGAEETFNSLSRDHRARFRDFSAFRGFLPRHLFAQMISKTTIWIYRFAPL